MAKLYIELPDKEFVLLAQDANNSCRSPRDQVRWIIRRALGLANANDQPTSDPIPRRRRPPSHGGGLTH